jgi:hypothetical protein
MQRSTAPPPNLDALLDLDGQMLVVDPEGGHWVRFVVTRVPASLEKPHGIDYSLTLPQMVLVSHRITGIDSGWCDPMNTRTPQPCWQISGVLSTMCCKSVE